MPKMRERQEKVGRGYLVKADAAQGRVTAIVSVFGVIDDGFPIRDVVQPGAFAKTIVENYRRIKVLDQHRTGSTEDVIATLISAREVGREGLPERTLAEHPEATGGLEVEVQFLMETHKGRETFTRIDAGAIDEYSFAYEALDVGYGKQVDPKTGQEVKVRFLKTLRLWEVSPVIWGMNEATATSGAKEMGEDGSVTKRLGDVLLGELYRTFNAKCSGWLIDGIINAGEYGKLNMLMGQGVAAISAGLDADLEQRALPGYGFDDFWFWMNADPQGLEKLARHIRSGKAGRVLSAENLTHLRAAADAINTVLVAADDVEPLAGLNDGSETTSDTDEAAAEQGGATSTDSASEQAGESEAVIAAASSTTATSSKAGPGGNQTEPPTSDEQRHREAQKRRLLMLSQSLSNQLPT